MIRKAIALIAAGFLLAALGGCAVNRATATSDPSTNWSTIKSVHVVKTAGEDGTIQRLIRDKLAAGGFSVTADPDSNPGADAKVTYLDRWMWDMTMYLLELTIVFRDSKTPCRSRVSRKLRRQPRSCRPPAAPMSSMPT